MSVACHTSEVPRIFLLFQVKIWFQNHRYKLKKARHEKGMMDVCCSGAGGLMHVAAAAAPPTTSPRRVSIPVLVRDGKPCRVLPQTTPCNIMPSSADYYSINSAAGYGESPSVAFQGTPYGMPSAGTAVAYYPSHSGSIGTTCPSHSATAAAAFYQTLSVNSMVTDLSGGTTNSTLPTAAAAMNSFNSAGTDAAASRDTTDARCYGQSRWW